MPLPVGDHCKLCENAAKINLVLAPGELGKFLSMIVNTDEGPTGPAGRWFSFNHIFEIPDEDAQTVFDDDAAITTYCMTHLPPKGVSQKGLFYVLVQGARSVKNNVKKYTFPYRMKDMIRMVFCGLFAHPHQEGQRIVTLTIEQIENVIKGIVKYSSNTSLHAEAEMAMKSLRHMKAAVTFWGRRIEDLNRRLLAYTGNLPITSKACNAIVDTVRKDYTMDPKLWPTDAPPT